MESQIIFEYSRNSRSDTTIPSPVITDGPTNKTTFTDSQVVLQCCVNSTIRPTITWFKRQEGPLTSFNDTAKLIQYSDILGVSHYYAALESAGEKHLPDGIYLSKLILNGVTDQDSGFYGCVAVNHGGYKIQEAHLNVLDAVDSENDEPEPGTRSLFLLFLIPVGLALAPLTLWTCYVLIRKQKMKQVEHKIDTNGNDYVQVNRLIV
ncbi:hypothetical protein HA402_003574 [Bradysia odoriphaga]|nr:hypothetical protein HA402_003574 [Bradysia odoriphaga]